MKRYYGKNAIPLWLIDTTMSRRYRSGTKRRSKNNSTTALQIIHAEKHRYDTHTMRAIEHIQDLPDLPLPLRRLTPPGRMYEIAKELAIAFIVLDPLDIIED